MLPTYLVANSSSSSNSAFLPAILCRCCRRYCRHTVHTVVWGNNAMIRRSASPDVWFSTPHSSGVQSRWQNRSWDIGYPASITAGLVSQIYMVLQETLHTFPANTLVSANLKQNFIATSLDISYESCVRPIPIWIRFDVAPNRWHPAFFSKWRFSNSLIVTGNWNRYKILY